MEKLRKIEIPGTKSRFVTNDPKFVPETFDNIQTIINYLCEEAADLGEETDQKSKTIAECMKLAARILFVVSSESVNGDTAFGDDLSESIGRVGIEGVCEFCAEDAWLAGEKIADGIFGSSPCD